MPLNVYETKTNRKKLIKAFYGKAECVGIEFVTDEDILELEREDEKVAYIPVHLLEEKQKRDANGMQALAITKKIGMKQMKKISEVTEEVTERLAKELPAISKAR